MAFIRENKLWPAFHWDEKVVARSPLTPVARQGYWAVP